VDGCERRNTSPATAFTSALRTSRLANGLICRPFPGGLTRFTRSLHWISFPLQRALPMDVKEFIQKTVTDNPVVLFMKGTAQFPQCGFSGRAIQLLRQSGVKSLVTVNVLEDEEVREGVKEYANWPTIPQLYVNGQFVGGSDIMMEMFESGELQTLLKEAQAV
jgi:monothiol glutaredoxin